MATTLKALTEQLARGEASSEELTRDAIARIKAHQDALNAFITVTEDAALEAAREADAARAAGRAGPLTGAPIAHKDIFCTRGVRTSCGSRMLDNFISPYDATVVARLNAAGTVMTGQNNMDEFAMGSSNETSFYEPARNPWDLQRVPGGSSGGSAAAVAAGLVPAATGTDTGGSIRQPAAFCGITGLKPTYGRVSRYGMVAFASSLDQGGPMARSAEDLALMLTAMAGFDPRDSTSVDRPLDNYEAALALDPSGVRIGLPRQYFEGIRDARITDALDTVRGELEKQGAHVQEVSLDHTRLAVPAYYVIASAECSTNLSRFDGVRYGHRCANPEDLEDLYMRSRDEGFGMEVKRRILTGTFALSVGYFDAYYLKAQQVRRLIRDDFLRAFEQVDVLLTPTTPTTAFELGEKLTDPVEMYQQDVFTTPASLAGVPAVSVPAGFVDGLPVGFQLIGPHFDEGRLLAVAHAWQSATDFHLRTPSTT
ncbi:MAG: Asp-tRNA(Asn)/Glu-tRNA(Gln) amidotransferase subunit GatA [Gammaproteobacteria bacterium]